MLRIVVICLALFVAGAAYSDNPAPSIRQTSRTIQNPATNTNNDANHKQNGTDDSPFVVKLKNTGKTDQESAEERKQINEQTAAFWWSVRVTWILAGCTFALALIAMWQVLETRATAKKQLRAYLTVMIGGATYQERKKNLKFAGKPRLINTGQTPAHNVRFIARAAILPTILPEDFDFPLPGQYIGGSVLGPHHFFDLNGVVDDFVPDGEIDDIKQARERALHIWGIVSYEDIFGVHQETRFCQTLTWIGRGKTAVIYGYYNPRHNDAT